VECIECGVRVDDRAEGWRGYRIDEPEREDMPLIGFYCPACPEREFRRLAPITDLGEPGS
jgi:hypothetical protein